MKTLALASASSAPPENDGIGAAVDDALPALLLAGVKLIERSDDAPAHVFMLPTWFQPWAAHILKLVDRSKEEAPEEEPRAPADAASAAAAQQQHANAAGAAADHGGCAPEPRLLSAAAASPPSAKRAAWQPKALAVLALALLCVVAGLVTAQDALHRYRRAHLAQALLHFCSACCFARHAAVFQFVRC